MYILVIISYNNYKADGMKGQYVNINLLKMVKSTRLFFVNWYKFNQIVYYNYLIIHFMHIFTITNVKIV